MPYLLKNRVRVIVQGTVLPVTTIGLAKVKESASFAVGVKNRKVTSIDIDRSQLTRSLTSGVALFIKRNFEQ